MLKKSLFRLAKAPFMGKALGNAFRFCSFAIPVKKVFQSKEIIAFFHPRPCYENHMILSPKKAIRNLQLLASEEDGKYLYSLWKAAQQICMEQRSYGDAFTLVANGGKRQEVQQVHFHMYTDERASLCLFGNAEGREAYRDDAVCILVYTRPGENLHFVLRPVSEKTEAEYLKKVMHGVDVLNRKYGVVSRGYSLVCRVNAKNIKGIPVFHVWAEKSEK